MNRSLRLRIAGAFAAIYVMWGGTFLAIRYAVADVPPLMTMVLRCAGGAAVLFAWLAWRGTLVPATRRQWSIAASRGRVALSRLPRPAGVGRAAGILG